MGVTYAVPSTVELASTRFNGSLVGRAALNARPSGGFSVSLEVPVAAGVALVGTYIVRCQGGCVATSGLTFAVTPMDH